MTQVLLMLLLGLDSAGINAAGFPSVGNFPGRVVSSGYGSEQDRGSAATALSAIDSLVTRSGYPEAFHWTHGSAMADPGDSRGPRNQARGNSGDGRFGARFSGAGDSPDEDFRWTGGAGMVGIGFLWQFR